MILASGAFDGLHAGHVAYLKAASEVSTDELVVAIAPNLYIRTAKQREARWQQSERADTVAAIRYVDRVVTHPELSIAETITRLRPKVVVKGIDWSGKLPMDVTAACVKVGARVVFVNTDGTHGAQVDWRAIGESL
jgi:cytidyltransferase-like protein